MLSTLGRRIERLFYLGFALIILCFIEVYFSSAAVYFHNTRETPASFYIQQIQNRFSELEQLYELSQKPKTPNSVEKNALIAKTRVSLGLRPEIVDTDSIKEKSYEEILTGILDSFQFKDFSEKKLFSNILSFKNSPQNIAEILQNIRKEELSKKGVIWGIETPRLFSMHYGKTDYSIPANFLALASFFALAPLVLAWLGSFYVTRKRELLLIRELHDFRQSFPHILNMFAVSFTKLARSLNLYQSRKVLYFERKINGFITACFRSVVIIIIILPMLFCLCYSSYNLFNLSSASNWIFIIFNLILIFTVLVLFIKILTQESLILYRKDFYA